MSICELLLICILSHPSVGGKTNWLDANISLLHKYISISLWKYSPLEMQTVNWEYSLCVCSETGHRMGNERKNHIKPLATDSRMK